MGEQCGAHWREESHGKATADTIGKGSGRHRYIRARSKRTTYVIREGSSQVAGTQSAELRCAAPLDAQRNENSLMHGNGA